MNKKLMLLIATLNMFLIPISTASDLIGDLDHHSQNTALSEGNYENKPPDPPIITGPTSGETRVMYSYNITINDPNGDFIRGYLIDFGDTTENHSCCPIPGNITIQVSRKWHHPGLYNIKTKAADEHGAWSKWSETLTVNITETDNTPPTIEIIKPVKAVYVQNKKIFSFPATLIIGKIDIEAEASDNETIITRVDFYVNNILKKRDYIKPYTWQWNETVFGKFKIKTTTYDIAGNQKSYEITLWKII